MEQAVEAESTELTTRARELIITDSDTYREGAQLFKLLGDMVKVVQDDAKSDIDHWKSGLKNAQSALKAKVDPLENLKARIRLLMASYDQNQANLAKRRQLELEAQAKEQAAKEAAELKERLAALDLHEEAEQVRAEEPAPVVVQKDVPKLDDIKYVERWHFEITDAAALPRDYLMPDEVKIGKVVRALKTEAKIPGVRVYSSRLPQ